MDRSAALDEAKLSAFEERLAAALNAGALCLMTSIGHRTGLFDAMAEMAPGTSAQIAAGASLNERYVREWLGAMVAAGVVEYDPETGTYALPPEHAARPCQRKPLEASRAAALASRDDEPVPLLQDVAKVATDQREQSRVS